MMWVAIIVVVLVVAAGMWVWITENIDQTETSFKAKMAAVKAAEDEARRWR